MERIVLRESRAGRSDIEARIWIAEHRRAVHRDRPQIPVLLVSPFEDDHAALMSMLRKPDFCLFRARSLRRADAVLRKAAIPVVIVESRFPGGCWRDVWTAAQRTVRGPLPRLIVVANREDDRLWNEVVHAGGYDVLSKPFESEELAGIITAAWDHWRLETEAAGVSA
ncbi:MAG: hypothetical protein ACM3S5_04625 [Rhodospirillales bacterium]